MKTVFPLLFLFIVSQVSAATSTSLTQVCQDAYVDIICLRINEASRKIETEKTANPGNTLPALLENTIDFLVWMTNEEKQDLEKLESRKNKRLKRLLEGDRNSPWFLYSQAEIFLQMGFARLKIGEYLSSGMEFNRAYRLLEENENKFHSFLPGKTRMGLLHAMVGAIPDKYRWAFEAMKFEGSVSMGMKELTYVYHECLKNNTYSYLLPETAFLMSYVSINLAGNVAGIHHVMSDLSDKGWLRNSPLACYFMANLKMKTGQNEEAIRILQSCQRKENQLPFHYLDFLLGKAKLNRLDNDAHLPLLSFVARFKGSSNIRSAYEHLAWYYLLRNDTVNYHIYMKRILLRGSDLVENDKQASRDAKNPAIPNAWLLKARLLFDGGYYQKSLDMLASFRNSAGMHSAKEKLEYYYRTARVYDQWGKKAEAVRFYELTLQFGKNDTSYFAANSALQLGIIYESEGKYAKAHSYYRQCLDLEFDEYEWSITQKAKAGIERVKSGK